VKELCLERALAEVYTVFVACLVVDLDFRFPSSCWCKA